MFSLEQTQQNKHFQISYFTYYKHSFWKKNIYNSDD